MSDAHPNEAEPTSEQRPVTITFRIDPPADCPVARSETRTRDLWVDVGPDRLRCDRLAEGEPTVDHHERPREEGCPCVIFRKHDAIPRLRAAGDEIVCTVSVPSSDVGRDLIESLPGRGTVEVADFAGPEEELPVTAPPTLDRTTLTEKQRQAIELAAERGYYAVPAEVTIEQLAAELELSPSAFGKRLKRAERTVVLQALSGR